MEAVFPRLKTLIMEALSTLLKAEVKITPNDKMLLRQKWTDFDKNKHTGRADVLADALCQCCTYLGRRRRISVTDI